MTPFLPPPIARPWLDAVASPDAAIFHAARNREVWRRARLREKAALGVLTFLWPFTLLALAARQTFMSGRIGTREVGKSYVTQFLEQFADGLKAVLLPKHYYLFELFKAEHRKARFNYLVNMPFASPIARVSRSDAKHSYLGDRRQFEERCAQGGVALVPCLAAFSGGKIAFSLVDANEVPPVDLFVKPMNGPAGRNVERWLYLRGQWHDGRTTLRAADLFARCSSLSHHQACMIQELLRSHPVFLGLAMGGQVVLRLLTIISPQGTPECHFAILRMPSRNGAISDDFRAGGIAAAVDLQSGIVGRATDLGIGRRSAWHATHPSSGAQIEGLRIPRFHEAVDLAKRAHMVFLDEPLIGWDVAITESGVALIEADCCPDLEVVQRTHQMPLGGTRFAQTLAWHLQRVDPALVKGSSVSSNDGGTRR